MDDSLQGKNGPYDFLDGCPAVSDRPSLALEPWTGTAFVLAALMSPKAKKEGTVGGAF